MKNSINSTARSMSIFVVLCTVLSITYGCSKDNSENDTLNNNNNTSANPNEIIIQGSSFSPSTIAVQAGTKVMWRNKDGMTHTVTSDSGLFDSGNIPNNGSYSFTFSAPGTYSYHCKIHAGMTGSVTVN